MAMGLKYEPGAGISLLTDFNGGQREAAARPENQSSEKILSEAVEPVIDVEAIEVIEGRVVVPKNQRHFDYLVYDRTALTVPVAFIGSRLDLRV